mmetsp:Transcript_22676/g.42422  ORF Transcript_22676/g.42422 Transcript_22676/m.42422 type:complete len:233 (+) Transcript_22676:211-909(+)
MVSVLLLDDIGETVDAHEVIVHNSTDCKLLDSECNGKELVLLSPVLDTLVLVGLEALGDHLKIGLSAEGLDLKHNERALTLALASLASSLLGSHLGVECLHSSNVLLVVVSEEVVIEVKVLLLSSSSGSSLASSGPSSALSLGESVHVLEEACYVSSLLGIYLNAGKEVEKLHISLRRSVAGNVAARCEEAGQLAHASGGLELFCGGDRHGACGEKRNTKTTSNGEETMVGL